MKILLACTLPLLVLPACNTVKETGRSRFLITSEREEIGLGADAYRQILSESKVVKGTPDAQMVARVGQRIAAAAEMGGYDYEWEFNLIDAPDSVNAFALPGGKVAIYTGILPITSNEDGLAAVMGHEIAHVTARHGGERMSQQFAAGVLTAAAAIGLEESDLEGLRDQVALFQGVEGFEAHWLEPEEIAKLEPRIGPGVLGGMYDYGNNAVDSHDFTKALAAAAETMGSTVRAGNVLTITTLSFPEL